MSHRLHRASAGLLLPIAFVLAACSGGDGGYGSARFVLTPTPDGTSYTVTVEAQYHDPVEGDCHLELYDIDGDNRYIQFSPYGINSSCEGYFDATIEHEGQEITMIGSILRVFGTNPSEPFASGTYNAMGGEFGTFLFYEDELPDL